MFSLLLNFPNFDQKTNFESIEILIQNTNFADNVNSEITSSNIQKNNDTQNSLSINTNNINNNKLSKNEIKKEDKQKNSNLIENEINKSETQKKENIGESNTESMVFEESSKDEESSDDIVQQILASQIEGSNTENASKDNIQWNSGANRWVIKKIKPILPKKYQEKGVTITCKVYIEINKFGSVISVMIVQSTGYIELDQYIISIIKDWKFNQVTNDKVDSGYITFVFVVS